MTARNVCTAWLVVALASSTIVVHGQGGGRGGGGFGGGGGAFTIPTRSVLLTQSLKLSPAQVKVAKATLDAAHKDAADARAKLAAAHSAIGAAISAQGDSAEIDAAIKAYAQASASMADIEMKALADVLKPLPEDVRTASARIDGAIALMRGAFIGKKWDEQVGLRNY